MANSPSHTWGQIIGEVLEGSVQDFLQRLADQHTLFLDFKRPREARAQINVGWIDLFGNRHDLDYVLERGGTESEIGVPAAFIEIAWRSYTKHSKNKAQEIEGALDPLHRTYQSSDPFLGCILAGRFTKPSLAQLRSRGIHVTHLQPEVVFSAFATAGIDASFGETTSDVEIERKLTQWNKLSPIQKTLVSSNLLAEARDEFIDLEDALVAAITRRISQVVVTGVHGRSSEPMSLVNAIDYIEAYGRRRATRDVFLRFEIEVRFSNGDSIAGTFEHDRDAIRFLLSFD